MPGFRRISGILARHRPQHIPKGRLRPAAVLLPIYQRAGEETILFTRRTDHLEHHSGEISFPGGARHPGDPDLAATALRETEEEMGIARGDVELLGRLDDFYSVHGYHVVPYVGTFAWPYPFRVNAEEIAEVIELPVARLRDPAIFHSEDWQHRGRVHPVHFFLIDGYQIWGLTAAILKQFLELTA
jgi:8-oxo-dGTP pyrophosphatase MutT (NUDIX family)